MLMDRKPRAAQLVHALQIESWELQLRYDQFSSWRTLVSPAESGQQAKSMVSETIYQFYGVEFIFWSRIALRIGQEQGLAPGSGVTNAL